MKLSFSGLLNSQMYQVAAAAQCKANIFVATAVAIFIMVFAHWGFGLWWYVIIPCLWFAVSLLVAMPFMILRVAAVAALSETPARARLASGIIDPLNYVVLVLVTYFGLWYLHGLVGFHHESTEKAPDTFVAQDAFAQALQDSHLKKKLQDLYLAKLDQWVAAGGDINTAQEQVVRNCGQLIIVSATPQQAKSFMHREQRDEFDSRVDVCATITVNRVHPQPVFEKANKVKMICEDGLDIFQELCRRGGLKEK